ncbi:MAG: MarR family transcriptional regulator [Marmoricola sp.]|nr:MarR family transcriptional regulator [Marmoricola sp.]
MAEVTQERADATSVDFGQALGTLLRQYLRNAGAVVSDLPGGPRGFQVMSIATTSVCSNQAAIAERLGLDRTVMTYLVDDLEKAGLVERRPDPADRRARQVMLTKKGKKSFETASSQIQHVERAVLGSLSDEEAGRFRELLMRVVAAGPVDTTACDGGADVSPTAC